MSGFIEGENRQQATMFPERLDDYITEDNSVRVIDVFIDYLDISALGFKTKPEHTGRPGYDPSTMLKLYVYGYLNQTQSSRRLEREAQRNVELMWLLGRLAPDFKTIADFRKNNGSGIKKVCKEFVLLCMKLDLLSTTCIAVDGSKFKAVNNSDRAFSKAKIERRLKKLDESIDRYLKEILRADNDDTQEATNTKQYLKSRLEKVKRETKRLKLLQAELLESPDQQISLTDPDSRIMATRGRSSVTVAYNVQSTVDVDNHLILDHDVTNIGNDRAQLSRMAIRAKEILGCDEMDVLADKGYFKGTEILACADENITAYIPKTDTSGKQGKGLFVRRDFKYIAEDNEYVCPAGERLIFRFRTVERGMTFDKYWSSACTTCGIKDKCTSGTNRRVTRWEHEDVLDELDKRMANEPERMATRRSTVEHPFGTIKSWMGHTHFQMKTITHVATEMSLHVLAYNLRRVLNILGPIALQKAIRSV